MRFRIEREQVSRLLAFDFALKGTREENAIAKCAKGTKRAASPARGARIERGGSAARGTASMRNHADENGG